jgi:restriction endonuclease
MATGSGKTFTAITAIYRLIKFAGARRVLFLVDRGNLGDQTLKEFQQYVSPYNNFKYTEEFIVQRLSSTFTTLPSHGRSYAQKNNPAPLVGRNGISSRQIPNLPYNSHQHNIRPPIAPKSIASLSPIVYTNYHPPGFFGSWARGRKSGLCFFS